MAHEVRFFCLNPLKLSLEVPSEYMGTRRACQRQLLRNLRNSKYAGQFFHPAYLVSRFAQNVTELRAKRN